MSRFGREFGMAGGNLSGLKAEGPGDLYTLVVTLFAAPARIMPAGAAHHEACRCTIGGANPGVNDPFQNGKLIGYLTSVRGDQDGRFRIVYLGLTVTFRRFPMASSLEQQILNQNNSEFTLFSSQSPFAAIIYELKFIQMLSSIIAAKK